MRKSIVAVFVLSAISGSSFAAQVNIGIDEVNRKVDQMGADVGTSFSDVENQFEELESATSRGIGEVNRKVDQMGADVATSISDVDNQVAELESATSRGIGEVNRKVDQMGADVATSISDVDNQVAELESATSRGIGEVNAKADANSADIAKVNAKATDGIASVNSRLDMFSAGIKKDMIDATVTANQAKVIAQDGIAQVSADVATMAANTAAAQKDIRDINTNIGTMLPAMSKQIAKANDAAQTANDNVAVVAATVSGMANNTQVATATAADASSVAHAASAQVAKVSKQADTNSSNIAMVAADVNTVAKKATQSIMSLNAVYNAGNAALRHELTTANTNINKRQSAIDGAQNVRLNQQEGQIKGLHSDLNNLSNEVHDFKKEARAGIAGIAAMANIPDPVAVGKFTVGAGVGYFNYESAVAVGAAYRQSDSVAYKLSVSANSGNTISPVIGAGVSYTFK
ncbi:hypothetical protein PEKONANI_02851 [Aeromonas jandaei]|uniref:YadA C-terminal domain-containing protein n=1 Tax=Aeromonas jandaei TaxID=650 RepID=UPI003670AA50